MDKDTIKFLYVFTGALYDAALNEAAMAQSISQSRHPEINLINRHLIVGNMLCHIADSLTKALKS